MRLYIFLKYRVRFRPQKCDYLKTLAEYVSHDITAAGNFPFQ